MQFLLLIFTVSLFVYYWANCDAEQLAKDWKPTIQTKHNSEARSLDVWFSLPDKSLQYGITNFTVGIIDVDVDPNNFIKGRGKKDVYIPTSSKANQGHVQFTELELETRYQIVVKVRDAFRMVTDKCQCYKLENIFGQQFKKCVNTCSSTRTDVFVLKRNETSTVEKNSPPKDMGIASNEQGGGILLIIACSIVMLINLINGHVSS